MKLIDDIAALFSPNFSLNRQQENNLEYRCGYSLPNPHLPGSAELMSFLERVPERDDVLVTYRIESLDDLVLTGRSQGDVDNFLSGLESKLTLRDEEDSVELSFFVTKKVSSGVMSVYSIDDLAEFWAEGGLVSSLKKIESFVSQAHVFFVNGLKSSAQTSSLKFLPFETAGYSSEKARGNRESIYAQRDKTSHFANASQFSFIPEDFCFDDVDPLLEPKVAPLFQELLLVSSLVYLCDFSKFDDMGNIHFRLGGYRLFSKDISAEERIPVAGGEYFDIYKWAYGDGDVIDKVGLARNIISLHLDNDDLIRVQSGTLQSISSGYQVYLKDNVKQYIEIKNKLSEFIQGSSEKASDIAKNVGGYYKNSIWTMYSFFISVFLIRVLSKDNQVLVTDEVFVLFIAFAIITLIIMKYALNELEDEKSRFIESYQSLKSRYCDLLIPDDLDRILESDRQHIADLKYIEKKKQDYRWLWGLSISVVFIVVSLLWVTKL